MNDYKVTVIVGIYNSADYLRKGLDSIVDQTWSNLEILLMNDGSTDNSGKICDEYSEKDERFIAIHKDNSGVCDSRNIGLEMATGDYVCFMDGDDWFSEDFVEYMMNIIIETNTSMAFSDKVFTTRDQKQSESDNIEIWDSERAICAIIYPYMVLGPWNKIYSMKVIKENNIKFPEHWFGETLHFASKVAYYSERIGVGHKKVYNYRLNNMNSGTTRFCVQDRLFALDNVLNLKKMIFFKKSNIKKAIEWHIFTNYYILIVSIIGSKSLKRYKNEYKNAKKYLRRNVFFVLINSRVNLKERVKIAIEGIFPSLFAKKQIRNKILKLREDIMN